LSARRDTEFTEYVQARLTRLLRVAYLLCQDWNRADDLVQAAVTRLYVHWGQARSADQIDEYVRAILAREFLGVRRSAWARRVVLAGSVPEVAALTGDRDVALDLRGALARLPPRQRATLVLRFYCDLSVDQAAQVLGCSAGTVKSQTAKGLGALRRILGPSGAEPQGGSAVPLVCTPPGRREDIAMDEQAVCALLKRLAETEQPPSRVDIAQARRDGRKKLRWRVAVIGAPVVAVVATVAVIAAGVVSFGPSSPSGGSKPTGQSSAQPSLASPRPSVATGQPTQPRYVGSGHKYLRPGFVHELLVSSSLTRLVLQAPPGVARWTLSGVSCSFRYTMIKKTPWGGIPGSGAGAGAAGCPWAPHLSLGATGEDYSRGVDFSVIGGTALPTTGVQVRVTLADGTTMTVTPHHAMWLVIVQRCGAYDKTAIKSVELLGAHGSVIARKALTPGAAPLRAPPC
jgi:RNA polymerase sigma-70 factor (sigma-E family)